MTSAFEGISYQKRVAFKYCPVSCILSVTISKIVPMVIFRPLSYQLFYLEPHDASRTMVALYNTAYDVPHSY